VAALTWENPVEKWTRFAGKSAVLTNNFHHFAPGVSETVFVSILEIFKTHQPCFLLHSAGFLH
jgi:hypothetical protein